MQKKIFIIILLFPILCFANIFDPLKSEALEELEENFSLSTDEELNNDHQNNNSSESSPQPSTEKIKTIITPKAELVMLNKVTSNSKNIIITKGKNIFFGNVEICLMKCIKSLDPYNPIDKMLVKLYEHKADSDPEQIFYNWLFSSNLSISTMTHPVYEVIAIKCIE